jgi:hypothetical protein
MLYEKPVCQFKITVFDDVTVQRAESNSLS